MANMLNTRIRLKYDTYANWSTEAAKKVVLLEGEVALVAISAAPTLDVNSVSAPQVLMKVGDGKTEFQNLPWISAKAADVHSWAKLSWEEFVAEVEGIKVKEAEFADEAGNAAKLGGQEASHYAVASDLSDLSDSLDAAKDELNGVKDGLSDVQSRLSVFEDGPLIGQAVPTGEFVEKVYVNTSLSTEEVIKILRKLNLSSRYVFLRTQEWDKAIEIWRSTNDEGQDYYYFGYADGSYLNIFNEDGWNPDFTGEIPFNANAAAGTGDDDGLQNQKLTQLFSITPFDEKTLNIYTKAETDELIVDLKGYMESQVEDVYGNLWGATDDLWAATDELLATNEELDGRLNTVECNLGFGDSLAVNAAPGTFIKDVYLNINLTPEEVCDIFSNASVGGNYTVFETDNNHLVFDYSNWTYSISFNGEKLFEYRSGRIDTGWTEAALNGDGHYSINEACGNVYGYGSNNNLLTSLVSLTPFINFYNKKEINSLVNGLSSSNKNLNTRLSTLEGNLGLGSPDVPYQTGDFIEKVYINTSLTPTEVIKVLNNVVPNQYDSYIVCETANHQVSLSRDNNKCYKIYVDYVELFAFNPGWTETGWTEAALSAGGCYVFNEECVPFEGGDKNNLITSLISATSFEGGLFYKKEEVNDLLDEKQGQLTAGANISIDDNVISATDTWRPISFLNNGSVAATVAEGEALSLGLTNIKATQTSGGSVNLDLTDTGVTAGTYNKVTVDAKGRITAASNESYAMSSDLDDMGDTIESIQNGDVQVGSAADADKLGGQSPDYYATASDVNSMETALTSGAFKVGAAKEADNAAKLDNHDSSYFATANDLADLNDRVDDVVAVAEGKTKTYVSEEDEFFLKIEDTLTFTYSASDSTISIGGVDVVAADLHIGDIVLVKELYFPDRWVSGIETQTGATYIYFSKLETTKVDLDPYQKKEITAIDVNGTSVNTVSGALSAIDTYVDAIAGSLSDLSDVVDGKQDQLTAGDFITIDSDNKISSSWRPVYVNSGSDFALQSSQNNELRFDTSEGSVVMKQGSGAGSLKVGLSDTGVAAGTYNNVTVDAKGRVTAGSNESYAMSDDLADLSDRIEVIEEVVTVEDGLLTLGDGKDRAVEIASEEFAIKTGDNQVETFSTHHMSTTINSDAITLKTHTGNTTLLNTNPTAITVGTSGLSTNINGNINLSVDGGTLKIKEHTITATSTSLAVNGNALAFSSEVGAVSSALSDLADGVDALTDRVGELEGDLGDRLDNIESGYLPLAGGTMTGNITFDGVNGIIMDGVTVLQKGMDSTVVLGNKDKTLNLYTSNRPGVNVKDSRQPSGTRYEGMAFTSDIPTNVVQYYEEDEIDTTEQVFVFCCGSASKLV